MKIGVFICHCGKNIAGTVDVKKVADVVKKNKLVTFSTDYMFMCSKSGQELIAQIIKDTGIDRVVVGACTPKLHEKTFRRVLERNNLNPFYLEFVNLREQNSWIHSDMELATIKAIDLVNGAIERAANLEAIDSTEYDVKKRALVVGAGVAGIQTALDLAEKNIEVVLIDKDATIGGYMAKLDKTFPTNDCSACILTPKMNDAFSHPNITVMTQTEVVSSERNGGNFEVELVQHPRFVDIDKCKSCYTCIGHCPVKKRPNKYFHGIGKTNAVFFPFAQSIPKAVVIDQDYCLYLKNRDKGRDVCRRCEKNCPSGAINFDQKPEHLTMSFGAVILATGFEDFDPSIIEEYNYGNSPDIMTNSEFGFLFNISGPTDGKLIKPSTKKPPKSVAFVQCVGSRDDIAGYCCNVGCMASLKHAYLTLKQYPDTKVYICYADMRTVGKGYEEYYKRIRELGVRFVRGKPSQIDILPNGQLGIKVYDSAIEKLEHLEVDIVALQVGMRPVKEASDIRLIFGVDPSSSEGKMVDYYKELHPKLEPVDTKAAGVYIAGCASSPKTITASVSEAKAAASSAASRLMTGKITLANNAAQVTEETCVGCGACVEVCPFDAIELKGAIKRVAWVNPTVCKKCGTCTTVCPTGSMQLPHYRTIQIVPQIKGMTEKDLEVEES
ncbi:MAG: CoB--CoM heterodisulfide reductase iron-sulfur subunit A family protein [Candidatus Heimdallarchaeota archaeon]|nr:CoB--CoM heterodisulfide reductase iron-sulfur subunit A family protein [Candidatus Heimdallarchaeota archaeon]MBY8996045.1 CoB--CoM heterodisulfide reductase iron-sulfur subunit A family protein [Candidatus Heimdallarchaeota archaeon]